MKTAKFILIAFLCFQLSGCGILSGEYFTKVESTSYTEKIYKLDRPLELIMSNDMANIEVFNWDKKEVKFEIKKRLRSALDQSKARNKFEDFDINIKQSEGKLTFNSKYIGSLQNTEDALLEIKLYIPKNIKTIAHTMDKGYIRYLDDVRCKMTMDIKKGQVDINRIDGEIHINLITGNLRIGSGRIFGDSNVQIQTGNINTKLNYDPTINFAYETKVGNIELFLPADLNMNIKSIGTVEKNDFVNVSGKNTLSVKSDIGKILLKKC